MSYPIQLHIPIHGIYEIDTSPKGMSLWRLTEGKRGRIPELTTKELERLVEYLASSCNQSTDTIKGYFQ